MPTTGKPLFHALAQHLRAGNRSLASVLQTLTEAHRANPIPAGERETPLPK